jgi:cytochrome c553
MRVIRWIASSGKRPLLLGSVIGLLMALSLLGVKYAPEVQGYYRFVRSVETTSTERAHESGPWPQLEEVCVPCHGYNGNPASQRYPRLAGQPQAYLVEQLTAFANGERTNPTMSPLALTLSVEEIKRLSGYFAAHRVTANAPSSPDPERLKKGEHLIGTGDCTACHGPRLEGRESVARLAGQGRDYLIKQLTDFRSGARRDPQGAMQAISASLSDEDIESLAQYLAHDTES